MKKLLITVVVLCCVLLCACREATSIGIIGGADGPTSVIVGKGGKEQAYDEWGIKMYAENVTPNSVTVCCEQFGGSLSGELYTGAAYTLEVFENDKWVDVATKNPDQPLVWNSMAYAIPNNELTKWEINFEYAYNDLQPGTYRIGKSIMDFRGAGDYDQKTYYAQFNIEV